jgi:hypothetical protein
MSEQQPIRASDIIAESKFTNLLKDIVKGAGGEWCGVQEAMFPDLPMVLFNSPASRSTLAVRFNPVAFDPSKLNEAIRAKIEASDAQFADRSVSVKVATLQKLQVAVSNLANEIAELIARR